MQDISVSRNYAEALLALATDANARDEWASLIHGVAGAIESDAVVKRFLQAPQVSAPQKRAIIAKGLEGKAPRTFVLFLEKLVSNRRQMLIPQIATAYTDLLDAAAGRVHARMTLAKPVSDAQRDAIAAALSKALKKTVVPHVHVNEQILGGIVVRVGDTVMDGSVKRRLAAVRSKMQGQQQ